MLIVSFFPALATVYEIHTSPSPPSPSQFLLFGGLLLGSRESRAACLPGTSGAPGMRTPSMPWMGILGVSLGGYDAFGSRLMTGAMCAWPEVASRMAATALATCLGVRLGMEVLLEREMRVGPPGRRLLWGGETEARALGTGVARGRVCYRGRSQEEA